MKRGCISCMLSVVSVMLFMLHAVPAHAAADQYRAEISAAYGHLESSDDFKMSAIGLSGEVFFEPVKLKDHPYAEASFLERVGSVYLDVTALDLEGFATKGDGMTYTIGTNLAKPGFPLALQLLYSTSDYDYDPPSTATYESDTYGIGIGNYFTDHLLVGIDYTSTKSEWKASIIPTQTYKVKEYNLFGRYVAELGGKHVSFEGELGQIKFEDDIETEKNTVVNLGADYFFNRALSAGIGIGTNSGDAKTEEGMTYEANARYFFTPQFSLQLEYARFLNSNATYASSWNYMVAAAARF